MPYILIFAMAFLLLKTNVKYSRVVLIFSVITDVIFLLMLIRGVWDGQVDRFNFFVSAAAFLLLLIAVTDGFKSAPRRSV